MIAEKITTDQNWTERAVVAIYRKQTSQEVNSMQTIEHNNVGFNGVDAPIMTSFAEWILRGRRLTPKQLSLAQRKIRKYAGQLASIAEQGSTQTPAAQELISSMPTSPAREQTANVFTSGQFDRASSSVVCQEASTLQFVPDEFISIDGKAYRFAIAEKSKEGELQEWVYTAEDASNTILVARIFND